MKNIKAMTDDMATNKQIVNKDYALINARYKLSNVQMKIILKVISLIKNDSDTDFMVYQLPLSFFDSMTSNKNYGRLSKECDKILEKVLHIEKPHGGWLKTHWFSAMEYKPTEKIIEVSIDERLKPYLLQLKKNFKYYELASVMNMESEYSIRIYEICKQYQKLGKRDMELKELHDLLQVPASYKKDFSFFRIKVLEIAQREINKYSDIEIDFTPIKRGRSTHSIIFTIKRNDKFKSVVDDKEVDIKEDLKPEQQIDTTINNIDVWNLSNDLIVDLSVHFGIAQSGNADLIMDFELYLDDAKDDFVEYAKKKNFKDMDKSFKKYLEIAQRNKWGFWSGQ